MSRFCKVIFALVVCWPNLAAAGSYEISQGLAEMQFIPVCVGRQETVRYARMLRTYFDRHPGTTLPVALAKTSGQLIGNGGDDFNCYYMDAKPIYHHDPPDVIDVAREFGIIIKRFNGYDLLFARADIIDNIGRVITAVEAGDYMYVLPFNPNEVRRTGP